MFGQREVIGLVKNEDPLIYPVQKGPNTRNCISRARVFLLPGRIPSSGQLECILTLACSHSTHVSAFLSSVQTLFLLNPTDSL